MSLSERGVVEKYGGTSLNSAERDTKVLEHVVETYRTEIGKGGYMFMVCSGAGKKDQTAEGRKATDHAVDIVEGRRPEQEWRVLEDILRRNVQEHGLDQEIINPYIAEARKILDSGNLDGEAGAKIVWLPERCKQYTLQAAARVLFPGLEFVVLDYAENGIVGRDDSAGHLNVAVEHEATLGLIPEIAKRKKLKGKIAILGGFSGTRSGTKELVTLERGMSDGTATYWGAALYLDEIRIYSDQEGLLPVDPSIISGLSPITELTYREAEAFAGLGANIIKDVAIRPACERGIPVKVLSSFDFQSQGTLIRANPSVEHYRVKAIAQVPGYDLITVHGMRMNEKGVAARVAALFATHGFNIDSEVDGDSCRTYAVKPSGNLAALREELAGQGHRTITINLITRIALVGQGMNSLAVEGGSAGQILLSILSERKIPQYMYSWSYDSVISSAFIPREYTHQAVISLYRALGFHRSPGA